MALQKLTLILLATSLAGLTACFDLGKDDTGNPEADADADADADSDADADADTDTDTDADTDPPADEDGDGYDETVDCNDRDPAIHPDARDIPCDGIDQDCVGGDNEPPEGCGGDEDRDGDGYTTDVDCDDDDPTVHPGARDIECDGIDQDCVGGDNEPPEGCGGGEDRDGDGYTDDVDCDDRDATVHPGARDIECDGIDQDCDGADAEPAEGCGGTSTWNSYAGWQTWDYFFDRGSAGDRNFSLRWDAADSGTFECDFCTWQFMLDLTYDRAGSYDDGLAADYGLNTDSYEAYALVEDYYFSGYPNPYDFLMYYSWYYYGWYIKTYDLTWNSRTGDFTYESGTEDLDLTSYGYRGYYYTNFYEGAAVVSP